MSNFAFLPTELQAIAEPAIKAEGYMNSWTLVSSKGRALREEPIIGSLNRQRTDNGPIWTENEMFRCDLKW